MTHYCDYCFQRNTEVKLISIIRKGYEQSFYACADCRKYLRGWFRYEKRELPRIPQ